MKSPNSVKKAQITRTISTKKSSKPTREKGAGPTRPLNAFFSFKKDHQDYISKNFPGLHCFDRNRVAANLWKTITPETKKKYEDQYKQELEIYKKESEMMHKQQFQQKMNLAREFPLITISEHDEYLVQSQLDSIKADQLLLNSMAGTTEEEKRVIAKIDWIKAAKQDQKHSRPVQMSDQDELQISSNLESIRELGNPAKKVKFMNEPNPPMAHNTGFQRYYDYYNPEFFNDAGHQPQVRTRTAKQPPAHLRLNTSIPLTRTDSEKSSSLTPNFHDKMSFGFTPTKSAFLRDYILPFGL